ncbi:hypothetical protein LVB77_09795 [Lysobacter sp. 5GHs7-4]|uniref:hypothetical protein n=1 Tax=Lysobacter sp. 5GHs7-4 TaxID=2904253 RepID=UPI001E57E990|nr:hypothetical protein [Lysobacter sp. 5GHs7-4]UHQ24938.1 hypothetical protein LVB77_09795 [Lysobacter sp. 5GHs7-4]
MNLRPALIGLLALTLSACVGFEHAPAAALSCDPDLVGTWRPKGDGPGRPAVVDRDCRAQWPVEDGKTVELSLRGYIAGPHRYLVLSPRDAERALGGDAPQGLAASVPPGGVFLVLYRIEGERLRAWLPDTRAVQRSIEARTLKGRKPSPQDSSVLVSSNGRALARVLAHGPEPVFGALDKQPPALNAERVTGAAP